MGRIGQYPASGYRHRDGGTLYGVGQNGYSWSLSVTTGSSGAHHLDFSNSWINPRCNDSRVDGYPVRCLQE